VVDRKILFFIKIGLFPFFLGGFSKGKGSCLRLAGAKTWRKMSILQISVATDLKKIRKKKIEDISY
jgi:hypothetical protein